MLSVSIGTAVYPEDGASIDSLFQSADRALYAMKQQKKAS
jgi:GGDEF domain-containing protein